MKFIIVIIIIIIISGCPWRSDTIRPCLQSGFLENRISSLIELKSGSQEFSVSFIGSSCCSSHLGLLLFSCCYYLFIFHTVIITFLLVGSSCCSSHLGLLLFSCCYYFFFLRTWVSGPRCARQAWSAWNLSSVRDVTTTYLPNVRPVLPMN
jgi:hypothetical protein